MNEIRIPYRPNKVLSILIALFFGACAVHMGELAATNDRGLILNRIVEFSTQGATMFYWVISMATLAMSIAGVAVFIASVFFKREIFINNSLITCPKNVISNKSVTINFSDITGIKIDSVQKTKIIRIYFTGGKLSISSASIPGAALFEELVLILKSRAKC